MEKDIDSLTFTGEHEFEENKKFKACEHGDLGPKAYLEKGTYICSKN